jgi:hypothetical protein
MGSFKFDKKGATEILKSMGGETHRVAVEIAGNVRAQEPDADVVVDDYVTDRAASSVTVREPEARIWEARDGLLAKAAGRAGFEVVAK